MLLHTVHNHYQYHHFYIYIDICIDIYTYTDFYIIFCIYFFTYIHTLSQHDPAMSRWYPCFCRGTNSSRHIHRPWPSHRLRSRLNAYIHRRKIILKNLAEKSFLNWSIQTRPLILNPFV
jgi:hypothetical protein